MLEKNIGFRSITFSIDLEKIHLKSYRNKIEKKVKFLRNSIEEKNVFVRTFRFNIVKISEIERLDKYLFLKKIGILSDFTKSINIRWFNISFDLINSNQKNTQNICSICYEILKRYSNAFINLVVSNEVKVNPNACYYISNLILDTSRISFNGYDNFRMGVSLNPKAGTPFFPFSFSSEDFGFSVAVEITSALISILKSNQNVIKELNLNKLKKIIFNHLTPQIIYFDKLLNDLSKEEKLVYFGQDLSLAPYPNEEISVVEILNLLGLYEIGSNGTLFYTAYLTSIIKSLTIKNNLKHVGFNGVMYSLLEDHLMCVANDKLLLDLDKIIGYSTLCGCGLDMVPVPGNITSEELASIMLDLASTAGKLEKPLGFRVLPTPNKLTNEKTEFNMDFLTNTRVMAIKNLSCNANIFSQSSIYFNE